VAAARGPGGGWHEDVCQGSNPVLHNSLVTPGPDFSVKPTLTGDTVVLRPFTADDFPGLLQVLRDPEVLKLTGSVHDEAAELVPENPAEEKKWRDRNVHPGPGVGRVPRRAVTNAQLGLQR
jgi:hypothetical protein